MFRQERNTMNKILLYGGTTEGRLAAEMLEDAGIPYELCVTTAYGRDLLPASVQAHTHVGVMDMPLMINFINKGRFSHVIDATHPYAVTASENIRQACSETGTVCMRILRNQETADLPVETVYVNDAVSACTKLASLTGPVLVTTGIKEVPDFLPLKGAISRLFFRVLPNADAVETLKKAGFTGSHIICMQGPFDTAMNIATLNHVRKIWHRENPDSAGTDVTLVTKQSGTAGGFAGKCEAAEKAGATLMIIGRPIPEDNGISLDELRQYLSEMTGTPLPDPVRDVWLIGAGMSRDHFTREADSALRSCDLIIGAKRMLALTASYGKASYCSYNYPEIVQYLAENPQFKKVAAVFSGDIGFYSGAAGMRKALESLPCKIHTVSGISAPVCFLNKIGQPWEDVYLSSLHGRSSAVTALVRRHSKTLFLLGKETDAADVCRLLENSGLENTHVTIGADLMQEIEMICTGVPKDFTGRTFSPLSMIYIENPDADNTPVACALPDEAFIRGNVPMTKAEIRAQVLSALQLTPRAILYDVGAGTGSVSVAAAGCIPEGHVFAIEKDPEALELIRQNCLKLQADNVTIIAGAAPDVEKPSETPTHAFIGGSSGNLEAIIKWLKDLNPECRIVLTAVTLETIANVTNFCKTHDLPDPDMIQIQASRAKKAGASHLMQAQNPVWIVTL